MNRIDKAVVFRPLRTDQLEQILEIELGMVQQRVLQTGKVRFCFELTPNARMFLLAEGTDVNYGARHLKRALERRLVHPLANLVASQQLSLGDVISIDWVRGHSALTFTKCPESSHLQAAKPAASISARSTLSQGARVAAYPTLINLPRRLTRA
jgi:ATP-dependent Clp protease ATP-binding subunit ClpB